MSRAERGGHRRESAHGANRRAQNQGVAVGRSATGDWRGDTCGEQLSGRNEERRGRLSAAATAQRLGVAASN
ncbi:unnamed protein product [Lampetra fluviatilis]